MLFGFARTEKEGEGNMAWFKCSSELFRTRIVTRLKDKIRKYDNEAVNRVHSFLEMLCYSADGYVYKSPEDIQKITSATQRQSEEIWSMCLDEKVLRRDRGGYSAVTWMIEQGILGEEYADPVKSKQRRRKSGEQPAISETTSSRQMSEEDEFRLTHDGKSPEEWEEMQRWRNSPEGKEDMKAIEERLRAIIGQ